MLVIAIERGYDGIVVREPGGAPFFMPDGSAGSWFVPCDDAGQPLKPLEPKVKRGHEVPGAGPKPGSAAKSINDTTGKSLAQVAAGPRRD